ncbi:MAG: patatin-like protein [Polyangiaceae bacterium]
MTKSESGRRSREVRLGVVMFGGVSLAVYINGVANELFRASRGRGVYRLLKALTDSDVVVDVLSGASAGGINGILLSTALCNGTEFNDTRTLWRDQADIGKLLQPAQDEKLNNSVLSGKYHQGQMANAFAALLNVEQPKSTELEDPSPVDELDLFITGTDIDGRLSYRVDALKHRIQLEDHRVLFQLKHRSDRKQPFSPQALQSSALNGTHPKGPEPYSRLDLPGINRDTLATLAHITSCFPGAFVPISVNVPVPKPLPPDPDPGGDVDGRLAYWGQLAVEDKCRKPISRRVTLMDGGVLKNKPFTSTIEAIFSRLADTQVARFMLYVDPDPQESAKDREQHDAAAIEQSSARKRHLVPVVLAAASGLPRFESIDADLQSIDTHNAQVRRYEALVAAATEAVMSDSSLPASQLNSARNSAYELARLGDLAQFVQGAMYPRIAPENPPPGTLFAALQRVRGTGGFSRSWDVRFGFRRLIQLTYSTDDAAQVTLPEEEGHRVTFLVPSRTAGEPARSFRVERPLLTTLNRQIELYEIVGARVEQALAELAPQLDPTTKVGWDAIEHAVHSVLAALPQPACFDPHAALDPLPDCVNEHELKALRQPGSTPHVAARPFLGAAEAFEQRLLGHFPNALPLLEMYQRFAHIDEVALPLALVSELKGRDQIHTVRVSPLDSKRAFARRFNAEHGERPINKLCGVQLFDFGAFFKCSWRSNDLMWGRIDGLSQLLDILLDPERLEQLEQSLLQKNLDDALGKHWDLTPVFPHSCKEQRAVLSAWLEALAHGDKRAAIAALREHAALREAWAHAAQLEVLAEELPQVLVHAESQLTGEALQDMQRQRERVSCASPALKGAAIDAYFSPANYKLGEQNLLADIPTTTLLKYATLAGTHLREALEQSLPTESMPQRLIRDLVDGVLKASQVGGLLYVRFLAAKARKKAASH